MSQITFTRREEPTQVIRRTSNEVPEFLYHYTSETSYWRIVKEGVILQSDNPRAVHHGQGVYLTPNPPGSSTEDILSNNYGAARITAGAKLTKLRYVFQFKMESLPRLSHVSTGERDIWVSRSDLRLADLEFKAYDRGDDGKLKKEVGTNEGCYDPFGGWHSFEPSPGRFRGLRQEDFPALSGSSDASASPRESVGSSNDLYGSGRRASTPELDEWRDENQLASPSSWDNNYDTENEVPYREPYNQPSSGFQQNYRQPYEERNQMLRRYQSGYGTQQNSPSTQSNYSAERYEAYDQSPPLYYRRQDIARPRPPILPIQRVNRGYHDYDSISNDLQNIHLTPVRVEQPVQMIRRDSYVLPSDDPQTSSWSGTHSIRPQPIQESRLYRPPSQPVSTRRSPSSMHLVQQPSRQRMPYFPNNVRSVRSSMYPY